MVHILDLGPGILHDIRRAEGSHRGHTLPYLVRDHDHGSCREYWCA